MNTRNNSSRDRAPCWNCRAASSALAGLFVAAALLAPNAAAQDDAQIQEADTLIHDAKMSMVDALGPADLPEDEEDRLRALAKDLMDVEHALAVAEALEAEDERDVDLPAVADRLDEMQAVLEQVLAEPDLDAEAAEGFEAALDDLADAEALLRGEGALTEDGEVDRAEALECPDVAAEALPGGDIRLTWTDAQSGATAVFRATDGDFDRIATVDPGVTTFVDDTLELGETARFAVASTDANADAVDACPVVGITAIPTLPTLGAVAFALAGGSIALVVARRR